MGDFLLWLLLFLLGIGPGLAIGYRMRKLTAEARIGSAEKEAEQIIDKARGDADSLKRERIIEAKDEAHRIRAEAEQEIREQRNDLARLERRLMSKEESLDRKQDAQEKREEELNRRESGIQDREN